MIFSFQGGLTGLTIWECDICRKVARLAGLFPQVIEEHSK
jgi:hypothetical protein